MTHPRFLHMAWSWSKISCLRSCHYKFRLQYLDKVSVPSADTISLDMGIVVHKVIEDLTRKYEETRILPNVEAALRIASPLIAEQTWEDPSHVYRCINGFVELFEPNEHGKQFPELEFAFTRDFEVRSWWDKSHDLFFRMKIDLLSLFPGDDGRVIVKIRDYKIGKRFVGTEQLEVYLYPLIHLLKIPLDYGIVEVLHLGSRAAEVRNLNSEEFKLRWEAITSEIDTYSQLTEFVPTTDPSTCYSCQYQNLCPHSLVPKESSLETSGLQTMESPPAQIPP